MIEICKKKVIDKEKILEREREQKRLSVGENIWNEKMRKKKMV